jgi:hypothetical protein
LLCVHACGLSTNECETEPSTVSLPATLTYAKPSKL